MGGQRAGDTEQSRLDRTTVRHGSLRTGLRRVEAAGQPEQGEEQAALEGGGGVGWGAE